MASLSPGKTPSIEELRVAQVRYALLVTELSRVRDAAIAWRNGLAGLLAAIVSFSLIKGRADVNLLRSPWSVVAGGLLLASLIAGGYGALLLLRAAHGYPRITKSSAIEPAVIGDHIEALAAARALRVGIVLVYCCAILLVCAVGVTWYGPSVGSA
jgi:hypothetical protein